MDKNKFNIGSKVAVIDDTIKGIIIAMKLNAITIKDENGFLLKYKSSELVQINMDILLESKNIIKKIDKEKYTKKSKEIKKNNAISSLEVDLHIHQITNSNKGMRNYDMLTKQVSIAKQKIEFAIRTNIKQVVFIHGVGKGVLKNELYQLLKNYPVKINDASYKKYGYGATEVTIYKNKIIP